MESTVKVSQETVQTEMPAAPMPYRILSFDGGGVHAVSYLPVVRELEELVDGGGLAACGDFQMFVGTSTGAIVATALKLGCPVAEVIKLYQENSRRIFTKDRFWNRLFHTYSTKNLRAVLGSCFRTYAGVSHDLTWEELCYSDIHPHVELVITLWDVCKGKKVLLSTNRDRAGQEKCLYQATVADIITACCAGPYFFPPCGFGRDGQTEQVFCDGGITGLNNPAVLAVALAGHAIREGPTPLHILSFGSGQSDETRAVRDLEKRVAWDIGMQTIDDLMNASAALMGEFYDAFGVRLGINKFFRTNQVRSANSKLDDVAALDALLLQHADRKIRCTLHTGTSQGVALCSTIDRDDLARMWTREFGLSQRSAVAVLPSKPSPNLARRTQCNLPFREVRTTWMRRLDLLLWLGLTFAFVVAFGLAVYFGNEFRSSNVKLEEKADELNKKTIALGIANGDLKKAETKLSDQFNEARKILQNYFDRYELPSHLGRFYAIAHEEPWPVGLLDRVNSELKLAKTWAPSSLLDRIVEFEKELSAWQTGMPVEALRAKARAAAYSFKPAWLEEPAKEFKELLKKERPKQYERLKDTVINLQKSATYQDAKSFRIVFWELYWGRLLFVESPAVERCQVIVGNALETWRNDMGEPPAELGKAIGALLQVVDSELESKNE